MLSVNDLTVHFGDRQSPTSACFSINQGDRLGLIEPNGAGTSTLLAIIADDRLPNAGTVSLAPGASVGYLRQGFAELEANHPRALMAGVSRQFGHLLTTMRQVAAATEARSAGCCPPCPRRKRAPTSTATCSTK